MELPPKVGAEISQLQATISKFEEILQPFEGIRLQELQQLKPLEAAQLQLGLAQSAMALFKLYLLSVGTDPSGHAVQKEEERLREYSRKIAAAREEEEAAAAKSSALSLDIAAANRFIEHAIPELTEDQRAQLRKAGAEAGEEQRAAAAAGAKGKKRANKRGAAAGPEAEETPEAFLCRVVGDTGGAGEGGKRRRHADEGAAGGEDSGRGGEPTEAAAAEKTDKKKKKKQKQKKKEEGR
uniref:Nuclear nucleic acid-binding protein C1D n=1 Tax=Tetraselmis sp. GSL018 TaxID=582737 RepID=A0A061R305_9CHLO